MQYQVKDGFASGLMAPRSPLTLDCVQIRERIDELAAEGLRTLAVAGRRIDEDLPEDGDELRDDPLGAGSGPRDLR